MTIQATLPIVRARILNDGMYTGTRTIDFPAVVYGFYDKKFGLVDVPYSELIRVGGNWDHEPHRVNLDACLCFDVDYGEVEVIEVIK